MKRLVLMIAAAALIAPLSAHARDWGPRFAPSMQSQGQQAKKDPGRYERGGRDARRDESPPRRDERRQGRLTEEERRELHRDLDRANREIYRRGKGW